MRFVPRNCFPPLPCALASTAAIALMITHPALAADFPESEAGTGNGTKATANAVNIGTATSATISGNSVNSTDQDYFHITTNYSTPGIYVNKLQLSNTANFLGSIRAQTQTAGATTGGVTAPSTINTGTDVILQVSSRSGTTPPATAMPFGFNQYYSFGGAGKTQEVTYKVVGATTSVGGSYSASFTSTLVTPTDVGSFPQGAITFDALANVGSSGQSTNTEIMVFDSGYNLYYDNVTGSPTYQYAASNDAAGGVGTNNGFSLKRQFKPGTYYFAVGISNLTTNDAAPIDDSMAARGSQVLDYDNVIATGNSFYDGNNGNTRPSDFKITNTLGQTTYTSSVQKIGSLYSVNFYKFSVTAFPEPGSLALLVLSGLPVLGVIARRRHKAA